MTKKGQKASAEKKEVAAASAAAAKEKEQNDANEEEANSGFGNYLSSSSGKIASETHLHINDVYVSLSHSLSLVEGQEMLKMFVVVNSIVMFLTIAWPQMQSSYEYLAQIINENFGSIELF
jgi:hypothetical protein